MAWPVCVPTTITLALLLLEKHLMGQPPQGVVHGLRVIDLSIVSGVATAPGKGC